MKKIFIFILMMISLGGFSQERMNFLGISFKNTNSEFQEKLVESGFSYTGDYYYYGEYMGCLRLLDFTPSCMVDEIMYVILKCTHSTEDLAISDLECLKKEYPNENRWDISDDCSIAYDNYGNEVIITRENTKVIIIFIDRISEERKILQK